MGLEEITTAMSALLDGDENMDTLDLTGMVLLTCFVISGPDVM